jgi:tetratricopeptide (TPR) repeat protein
MACLSASSEMYPASQSVASHRIVRSSSQIWIGFLLMFFLAQTMFPAAVHSQSQPPADRIAQAEELLQSEQLMESLEIYRQLLHIHPDNYDLQLRVGQLLGWTGQYAEAISHLNGMLRENPRNVEVLSTLATTYAWMRNFGEAQQTLQKILQINPNSSDALALRAQFLFWQGRPYQAWKQAKAVQKQFPGEIRALQLVETLEKDAHPEFESFYLQPWDSDNIRLHVVGQTLQMMIRPGMHGSFGWTFYDSENTFSGQTGRNTQINTGLRYQHSQAWSFRGNLGASVLPDTSGSSATFVQAGAGVQYSLPKSGVLALNANRFSLSESPVLIQNRLTLHQIILSYSINGDWGSALIAPEATFFSDTNQRAGVSGSYQYPILSGQFTLRPGIFSVVQQFAKDIPGQGYFSPERLTRAVATSDLSWNETGTGIYVLTSYQLGAQQIKLHSGQAEDPTLSWQARLKAGYRTAGGWSAEVGYLYSNTQQLAAQTAGSDYAYQMVEFRLKFRLNRLANPFI